MNLIFLLQVAQKGGGMSFLFVAILLILLIRLFMGYESICYKLGRLIGRLFRFKRRDVIVPPPIVKNRRKSTKELYKEELIDPRWKEKREKILNRDGYKCCWCGRKDHLHIHHKYYSKYPDGSRAKAWDYPDDALITLCEDCHKTYHSKYKIRFYYRKNGTHY